MIATTDDAAATVRIDGTAVTSGMPHRLNLAEGDNVVVIEVTAADGTTTRNYELAITRRTLAQFAQQAYVKASNTGAEDLFGTSVALSGDTLAVGALEDSQATGVSIDGAGEADDTAEGAGAVYIVR